jgi:hypothetical protein
MARIKSCFEPVPARKNPPTSVCASDPTKASPEQFAKYPGFVGVSTVSAAAGVVFVPDEFVAAHE